MRMRLSVQESISSTGRKKEQPGQVSAMRYTGYNLFVAEMMPLARAQSSDGSATRAMADVAKQWKALTEAERDSYKHRALKVREDKMKALQNK